MNRRRNPPKKSATLSDIVIENHNRFLSFLSARLESKEVAEEILHSAYLKGLKRQGTLKDNEKITAWFYRLLKNSLTDYYRHKAAEKRAIEKLGAENEREQIQKNQQLEKNVCQCVNRVMKKLKPEYAEVLQKAEVEDQSINNLASKMKTTPTNLSVRLHRARVKLKQQLLDACGACADHGCLNCTCKD